MSRKQKPTKKQKKRQTGTRLTINVQKVAKECTKLNVGKDAMIELRAYTEEVVIPKIVLLAERAAEIEKKKTIQERDVVRAKDYLSSVMNRL